MSPLPLTELLAELSIQTYIHEELIVESVKTTGLHMEVC